MPSIKININSRVMPNQKNTTFTENTARFFLAAWQSIDIESAGEPIDWLATSHSTTEGGARSYASREVVTKSFQSAINKMITHYDMIYGLEEIDPDRWKRDNLEYHILYTIAHRVI